MERSLPAGWHESPISPISHDDWLNAQCVYCGGQKDDSDHIPPKSMFTPESKIGEMLTVPSCRRCNRRYSESGDDDRFRNLMASWCAAENKIAADMLAGKVERSGRWRPDLLKQKCSREKLIEQFSDSGIYIGTKKERFPFTKLEEACIWRMADRLSRGLYWIYSKRIAPMTYKANLVTPDMVNRVEPGFLHALKEAPWVSRTNPEVFMSKSIASSAQIHHLISMFVFYKKFTLLVFFGEVDEKVLTVSIP